MRTLSFDGFELTTELRRAGRHVHLEPKPLAVLRCLLEHSDRRVTLDELRRAGWGSVRTSSASVHNAISAVRAALDGDTLISGKHGVGYQIHVEPKVVGQVGKAEHWRYYAAHATGTAEERVAMADALILAQHERYSA